jgi:major membrane immunogen (membrane-anchored lipoprotein)
MKTVISLVLVCLLLLSACGPKSYSETVIGKKRLKYDNKTQAGMHPKKGRLRIFLVSYKAAEFTSFVWR